VARERRAAILQTDGGFEVQIRKLTTKDEHLLLGVHPGLLDRGIQPELASEFLKDPRHHFIAAIDSGDIIGFVSALHYIHPDKPPRLWINEVGVAPGFRGRGVGKAMMAKVLSMAAELGCTEAWTLTEPDNEAATALYTSVGGAPSPSIMYRFPLGS
jgi:ribosomal protein S18 acetylase RimI-like enzyme